MRYTRVFLDAIGYELAPAVVSSSDLERRLRPVLEFLRVPEGYLEAITGIIERRWWEPGFSLATGATLAAEKALERSSVEPQDLDALIYAGVCREDLEPATACKIAANLGVNSDAILYDISNACLGVLNGILNIANQIELGQIRAGMVVACETAREIVEVMVERLLKERSMELFKKALATMTGGSGAAAVLVTDGSFPSPCRHRLMGAVTKTAPEHHRLCRWGFDRVSPSSFVQSMATDSVKVLQYGVELGKSTWRSLLKELGWVNQAVDKVICHQVGAAHQEVILKNLGVPEDKDFTTYRYLGNIGTVSLPLTTALAEERQFLQKGDRVALLGIGSGLNCLMLGVEW